MLISAGYDFLTGPLSNLASNKTAVPLILKQAERLANNLAFAFDTPTGIPANGLYFNPQGTDGSTTNGLATIGTLVLEWTHLSDLTGNKTYGELAQKGESYLLAPKPASSEPWPVSYLFLHLLPHLAAYWPSFPCLIPQNCCDCNLDQAS